MNRGFYCNKQRMIRNKGSIHAHFLDVKTISFNLKNFIQLFVMLVIYRFDFDLLTKLVLNTISAPISNISHFALEMILICYSIN